MLKKFGRSSKLAAVLLVLTLVFMAGCQAVSNVDFNKTLTNALKVTSSESKQSVELKLELDEEALEGSSEEEIALMKLLSHMKLTLDNVKAQDNEHVSMNGSLSFGEAASIGFSLKMSDTLAVMELEGAKQPFVLDLTSESLLGLTGMPAEAITDQPEPDKETFAALGHQLLDTVGTYVIHNLPNPDRIEVKPANELINGSSASLMHVHIDMNGPEIWAWVKKYVDALAADRDGLDRMIAGVFELIEDNPEIWTAMGTGNTLEENRLDGPTQEEVLEEATDEIAAMLAEWQKQLRLMEEEEQETLDQIFSESLTVKADVYIDSRLDIRKQAYELSYVPGEDIQAEMTPFKGLTLKLESEVWNVNGAVTAEAPEASEEALDVQELAEMQGYQVLKQFEEQSFLYDLLKNKFHIGRQSISWYPYDYYNPVIVTATHRTLIPLRDTVVQLGAELTYDAKTKRLKVYDEATDTTIELRMDDDSAVVNGKKAKWSFPVTVIDGVTYVPARDLAKALDAKIAWTVIYEDEKIFTFEREV